MTGRGNVSRMACARSAYAYSILHNCLRAVGLVQRTSWHEALRSWLTPKPVMPKHITQLLESGWSCTKYKLARNLTQLAYAKPVMPEHITQLLESCWSCTQVQEDLVAVGNYILGCFATTRKAQMQCTPKGGSTQLPM